MHCDFSFLIFNFKMIDMQIGMIGLGKMGGNMALKLLEGGHSVVAWNRSPEPAQELKTTTQNLKVSKTIKELVESLGKPRVVWLMVTVGATDDILDEIGKYVEEGDIIIDGSNANYKDTQRRFEDFEKKGIRFLGMGVAGGIHGPKLGYALMVGGNKSAYDHVVPLMDTLVRPKADHAYFGAGGAGHFVKMIHNGIEYGYMQAIGEGFDVLEHAPYKYDLTKIAKLWAKNSLISGFMMDRTVETLEKDPHMKQLDGVINATGEAQWTVDTAKELGIPVEIIERSLEYRKRSQTDPEIKKSFTAKTVAAIRNAFGGHEVKKK